MKPSEELEALKKFLKEEGGTECFGDEKIETPIGVFVHVMTVVGPNLRWQGVMAEIYKSPSGAFFSLPWRRANTESQEHDYYIEDALEVEPHEVTVTQYRAKTP